MPSESKKTQQVLEQVKAPPMPKLVEPTHSVNIETPLQPASRTPPYIPQAPLPPPQYTMPMYTPYQYAQSNMMPYGTDSIYAYPPVPQQQTLLPILRGKPRKMDAFWIGLYVVVGWILYALMAANSHPTAVGSYQSGLLFIVLLLWYFLSGCLLGSWRSLLALVTGSSIALLYIQLAITHDALTISNIVSYGLLSLVGAFIGCCYEWRKTQKKLHSFFIFTLGIFLFFILAEFINSAYEIAAHIPELLVFTCLSPVVAIVPFLCELLIRGIVKLVFRFVRGRKVA